MTTALERRPQSGFPAAEEGEISLMAIANALLRGRKTIVGIAFLGGVVGGLTGLMSPKTFRSSATFIPQSGESSNMGGLAALAASQFGIRVATEAGGLWNSAMYVEVLKSRPLLDPIARDSFTVVEEGGRRAALMDLWRAVGETPDLRAEYTIKLLRERVGVREDKKLSMVTVSVATKWPSVSLALVERLLARLNEFNIATRKSKATAERQFVEREAQNAERLLRAAEDSLQEFKERNKVIAGSPELQKRQDRLNAEVTLRNQLYNGWMQNREEARIKEVRDTPVLTILDAPTLALRREARGTVTKAIMGGLIGTLIGMFIAITVAATKQRTPSPEEQEFMSLLRESIPRALRRGT